LVAPTCLVGVIEVAADQPLDSYLASAIFTPLGMIEQRLLRAAGQGGAVGRRVRGRPLVCWHRVDTLYTNEIIEHIPLLLRRRWLRLDGA